MGIPGIKTTINHISHTLSNFSLKLWFLYCSISNFNKLEYYRTKNSYRHRSRFTPKVAGKFLHQHLLVPLFRQQPIPPTLSTSLFFFHFSSLLQLSQSFHSYLKSQFLNCSTVAPTYPFKCAFYMYLSLFKKQIDVCI